VAACSDERASDTTSGDERGAAFRDKARPSASTVCWATSWWCRREVYRTVVARSRSATASNLVVDLSAGPRSHVRRLRKVAM